LELPPTEDHQYFARISAADLLAQFDFGMKAEKERGLGIYFIPREMEVPANQKEIFEFERIGWPFRPRNPKSSTCSIIPEFFCSRICIGF